MDRSGVRTVVAVRVGARIDVGDAHRTRAVARRSRDPLPRSCPPTSVFGTSSWSFPGWAGIVYSAERTTSALARDGLREYATHPLLRTVGIDRSYYAPIPVEDLRAYAEQLPEGFPLLHQGARRGDRADARATQRPRPTRNPDFLSIDRLVDDLLAPLSLAFRGHTGPIILEFPPFARGRSLEPAAFLDRLERFLERLPREFDYAVELRDRTLLTPALPRDPGDARRGTHLQLLECDADAGRTGRRSSRPKTLPFSVIRLLLKPGTWYEDQREAFRPFNRLRGAGCRRCATRSPPSRARAEASEARLHSREQQGGRIVAADDRCAREAARRGE